MSRETQTNTTMRYHLTPVRMAIIQKPTNSKCCRGCGEKGPLLHCWWERKLVLPLSKTVWKYLRNLYIEQPCDPAVPLLGIYLDKTVIQKDTCTHMLVAALFPIAKTCKQPKCPSTHDWIRKMSYIYTMEYYSAIKMKKQCHLQQHGTRDSHPEWSQKDKEIPYDVTYLTSNTWHNWTFPQKWKSWTWRTDLWLPGGGRVGSGGFGELGVLGCKLLPLEWMSNEVLLWSTENYVSSLMTEPEHGRNENGYMYVWLGHHAIQ